MATLALFQAGDDGAGNPTVVGEIDIDAQDRVTRCRVIDNSPFAAYVALRRTADLGDEPGLFYEGRFAPGTTFISIPTGAASRIKARLSATPPIRLLGVDREVIYPVP